MLTDQHVKLVIATIFSIMIFGSNIIYKSLANLQQEKVYYFNPSLSPGQKKVAFESTKEGKFAIYTVDRDGNNLKKLTGNKSDNEQPAWSPDGEKIAFITDRDGHSQLYIMDADGANQTRLTEGADEDYDPKWSSGQKWIVFKSRPKGGFIHDIFLIDINGNNRRRLTNHDFNDLWASWSPNGKFIALARRKVMPGITSYSKFSEDTVNKYDIWRIKMSDFSIQNLTKTNSQDELLPRWPLPVSHYTF